MCSKRVDWHTGWFVSRKHKVGLIGVALLAWVLVNPFTWRDLTRRSPDEVRAKKWMWGLASTNLTGSVAYFLFGRKPSD